MKPFDNVTSDGNEKAIRRGRMVPDGDVNLSYFRSPRFSPEENVVIVDTSRIVEENVSQGVHGCKLYYANSLGILVDKDDNVAVSDEYPVITDVFSADEDFANVPASTYKNEHILPYMHTSRHFHLDFAGLVMGGDTVTHDTDAIKVVDDKGNEYDNYRIKITPAYLPGNEAEGDTWAYRVFAYVDTKDNDDLHLMYNKVELTQNAELVRRRINYQEVLNPQPFFKYIPEESEVVDPENRHKKQFSTKPTAMKDIVLGKPTEDVDGYKIYVPRKAVGDPRLYQLFRWRVKCTFTQDVRVDPSREMVVNCGVVVTSSDLERHAPSRAPFAFLNLSRSRYNAKGLIFRNPARPDHSSAEQEKREYWLVNIDTDDLSKYDVLLWAPQIVQVDFSPYAGKISDFTRNHGGTIFIDTGNHSDPFQSHGGHVSVPVNSFSGRAKTNGWSGNNVTTPGRSELAQWGEKEHPLISGNLLGGWNLEETLPRMPPVSQRELDELPTFTNDNGHLETDFSDVITPYLYVVDNLGVRFVIDASTRTRWRVLGPGSQAAAAILYGNPTSDGPAFSDVYLSNWTEPGDVVHDLFDGPGDMEKVIEGEKPDPFTGEPWEKVIVEMPTAPRYSPYFHETPSGYRTLIEVPLDGTQGSDSPTYKPTLIIKKEGDSSGDFGISNPGGYRILSTMKHLGTCGALYSYIDGSLVWGGRGANLKRVDDYDSHVSSLMVEGAMKLLYNAALCGVKGRLLDDSDEDAYSTSWTYTTPWKSSWVIDAGDNILNNQEKAENNFLIDAKDVHADPPELEPVWKRRLANKTVKQLMDEALKPIMENPGTAGRVEGSDRSYAIEATNPLVNVGSKVIENDYPQAWTKAFTPRFTVPVDIGPHIIKEDRVDSQYDDLTYTRREYPEKPYGGRVSNTYIATEEIGAINTANYSASGTAVATIKTTEETPPSTTSVTEDLELSWWDAQVAHLSSSSRGSWHTPGTRWQVTNSKPFRGVNRPWGIRTWQEHNYRNTDWGPGNLNWPFFVSWGRLVQGSAGDLVRFVQHAMNRFMTNGYFSSTTGTLTIDGAYGPTTSSAVRQFQQEMNARYIDGVIDAETWSLIGFQVLRLRVDGKLPTANSNNYTKWYDHAGRIAMHRVSNGNTGNGWGKRSWHSNGPSTIWELFAVRFGNYNWRGVTVVPWVAGNANTMMVRSIHVTDWGNLGNYNSQSGQLTYMPHRPKDGESLYIPFGPYQGDTIILGVGQDKSSGRGTSRFLGLRDFRAHTRVTSTETTPSSTNVTYQQEDITFTVTGSIDVETFKDTTVQLQPPSFSQYHSVSDVKFNSITSSNPYVNASITQGGLATFRSQIVETNTGTEITEGDRFGQAAEPGFTHYSMDENGRFNPVPETGWVSKSDGIKLLCDQDKKPIGFPDMPTDVDADDAQRHYVKLAISSIGTDSSVQIGFYDKNLQQFVTSAEGKPEISYLEYVKRGPQNMYVGVISDYESSEKAVIPVDDDAPKLPYRWAMPVYGVCTEAGSRITLESLPDKLGSTDLWPIAVREGKFARTIKIRSREEGVLTNYLKSYQDATVHAFYGLPEARLGGYSTIYGPPNVDIKDEEPLILDDDVIKVRQPPILLTTHPTEHPNPADPVRPVFRLFKRPNRNAGWQEQPLHRIRDYNVRTGEIYLLDHLTSNDASLLRVDYTSTRKQYHFKRHDDVLLNLNAYSGHARDLLGEAIYVYIVPHYVKDSSGRVIDESVQERTLRISMSPDVFNPLSSDYDPLAVQLGVVYLSTALDIDHLAMMDTRRRGGGIRDNMNVKEINRLINEATSYWDIDYAAGGSYQRSGYVVVRLPEELKSENGGNFSEAELVKIIKRNMTAGVGFKIEDLQGRDWS